MYVCNDFELLCLIGSIDKDESKGSVTLNDQIQGTRSTNV